MMKLLLIILALAFMLAILYLILIIPRFRKPNYQPLLHPYYAHRGLHNTARGIPENSMKAFQEAVAGGYGIELDVQLSKDEIPVVFHDSNLRRMCGVDANVSSLSLDELKRLSLGGTQERIPTFQEFLEMVDGRVPLIVEIKMEKRNDRIPEEVNRLLEKYQGPYCIESFHPSALIWYRKHRPDVVRGQLCTNFNKENKNCSLPYFLLRVILYNVRR